MSREIKFRAWDKKRNEMFPVHELEFNKTDSVLCNLKGYDDWDEDGWTVHGGGKMQYANEPRYELMQYTGLKDRNRCEIYEGDIVLCKHWQSKFKVVFEAGMFRCRNIASGYEDQKVSLATFFGEVGCTVIGNIYEHPELLEGTV
jgi:uncharacterized phage protein (TIGR01671 family)